MKKLIKKFNLFEILWLLSAIIILIVSCVFFPDLMFEETSSVWIIVCSGISIISAPVCEILISKQNKLWCLISLVEVLDVFVLIHLGLYSSAVVSLFFWVPMEIATYLKWRKYKDNDDETVTKVRMLPFKYDIIIICLTVLAGFVFGYIMSFIPSAEITYLVAFTNLFEIENGIFLLLRYDEQWFAWLGYVICDMVCWILVGHYIMLVTSIAMLINTIYGMIKWIKYIRHHSK